MQKSVNFELNRYPIIPHELRSSPRANIAGSMIDIDMAELFHHYYLDTHGHRPPNPDPARFEHLEFFLPQRELRLRGDGFGISRAARRNRSNELGQAVCRWFLARFFNIHYFAHMEHVLGKRLIKAFAGYRLERTQSGDAPDYLCAENVDKIFVAEAKGRRESISFGSSMFASWRRQFARVELINPLGRPERIKGHIIATRFAAESDGPRVRATIFAEDPETAGDQPVAPETGVAGVVMQLHYANIAGKLAQRILSSALRNDYTVPDEIRFPASVWEIRVGPLEGRRFVGGFFNRDGDRINLVDDGKGHVQAYSPLQLDEPAGTFFGLDEEIFKVLASVAREGAARLRDIRPIDTPPFFDSGLSLLRDGSVIGPLEFFRALEPVSF